MINANASATTDMRETFGVIVEMIIDGEMSTLAITKAIQDMDIEKFHEGNIAIGDLIAFSEDIETTLEEYFNGEAKEQLLEHLNRKIKLEISKFFMTMQEHDKAYIIVDEEDVESLPKWFYCLTEIYNIAVRIKGEDFYFMVEEGALVNTKMVADEEDLCISGDGKECSNCGTCCEEEDDMYEGGCTFGGTCEGFVCEDCEHNDEREDKSDEDFERAMLKAIDILFGSSDIEEHLCTQCGACGKEFN